jgi:hypothetical protein
MSKVNYREGSPYAKTQQTSWFLSNMTFIDVPRDVTDEFIPALPSKYEHRPHLLSYDKFGTPDLWWVFSVLNPDLFKDPVYDMKAGMALYCPSMSRISTIRGG